MKKQFIGDNLLRLLCGLIIFTVLAACILILIGTWQLLHVMPALRIGIPLGIVFAWAVGWLVERYL